MPYTTQDDPYSVEKQLQQANIALMGSSAAMPSGTALSIFSSSDPAKQVEEARQYVKDLQMLGGARPGSTSFYGRAQFYKEAGLSGLDDLTAGQRRFVGMGLLAALAFAVFILRGSR